ncbi:MAG: hypothetical protein ACOCPQ_01715 [Desulfosudaceae bacterium]
MEDIYRELRQAARSIAAQYPSPDFYYDFPLSMARSRKIFEDDELIKSLRKIVQEESPDHIGHGLEHAETVALDAGAITAIETDRADFSPEQINHAVLLALCAGLLHDIRRQEADHAVQGAAAARQILARQMVLELARERSLGARDINRIAFAIEHHEAFKSYSRPRSVESRVLAGSLYDADKFRWGPDNFTCTVWDMIAASPPPPEKFARLYPRAMAYIAGIKETFRTAVGREYGPQFIDIGLDIGNALWHRLQERLPRTD